MAGKGGRDLVLPKKIHGMLAILQGDMEVRVGYYKSVMKRRETLVVFASLVFIVQKPRVMAVNENVRGVVQLSIFESIF